MALQLTLTTTLVQEEARKQELFYMLKFLCLALIIIDYANLQTMRDI